MLTIRQEVPADLPPVRSVHEAAFGGALVADLADALRAADAALKPISLVADDEGRVIGHAMLSTSRLDTPSRLLDIYVLSPLSVHPDFQRRGIGTALIRHALEAAERAGVPLVFLEGNPTLYSRCGFAQASPHGFRSPSLRIPDPAFQVAMLPSYEPWMTGTLVYSETFWAMDAVGLR